MTTTSKIKIKLGPIEIEYEGSESFLKEELPQLLSAVSDLYAKSSVQLNAPSGSAEGNGLSGDAKKKIEGTTGALAAKLSVKSGPDLILAAAARLTLVLNTPTFSRQSVIDEIKTASAYYRQSYVSNLSSLLNGLVKEGKFNEPSAGHYALSAAALQNLESRIAPA